MRGRERRREKEGEEDSSRDEKISIAREGSCGKPYARRKIFVARGRGRRKMSREERRGKERKKKEKKETGRTGKSVEERGSGRKEGERLLSRQKKFCRERGELWRERKEDEGDTERGRGWER